MPGDSCVNGVKYDPITLPCPYGGIFGGTGLTLFIVVIFVFGVVAYVLINGGYTCSIDVSALFEYFAKQKQPSYKSTQSTYKEVDLNDEDNELFDDDSKILQSK